MADAGIPLHVLQEILGHHLIETSKGYLHPDHRHLAEAARQANQFLSKTLLGKTPAAATDTDCDRLRPHAPTSQGGRSTVVPSFGAPHGHLLVHSTAGEAEPKWTNPRTSTEGGSVKCTSQ